MIAYQRYPLTRNRKYAFTRLLDKTAEVLVNVGDVVNPETVISQGWSKSGFRVFNLSELFGIEPEKASQLLQRTIGSRVYQGDELAVYKQIFGLKEKVFKSPISGILVDYDSTTSKLTIQYLPKELKLAAGVFGRVIEILPEKWVKIGTRIDRMIGVVGFGIQREGSLIEVGYPDIPIQADQISPKYANKIIFGGSQVGVDVLYKALSVGVKGIVTGGMNYADFIKLIGSRGRLEDVGISVILTEGFGSLPIYKPVYDFLKENEFRHSVLVPKKNSVVVPISSEVLSESDLPKKIVKPNEKSRGRFGLVNKGDKVRLLSSTEFGNYGIVSNVDKKAALLEVTLEKDKVEVPVTDVEVLVE